MSTSITSAFTEVKGVNIHYRTAGSGTALLLLHGWPTSSYLYREIIEQVSENHQVIAMDLPGFGKSDKKLEDSYSFRYHTRILNGFLENLKLDKVTLGVHDMGGPIGLYWMTHHMEKVERLILFNTLIYPKFSFMVKLFAFATIAPGIKTALISPWGIKRSMHFGVFQKEKLNDEIIRNYQEPFLGKKERLLLIKTVQRLSMQAYGEIAKTLPNFKGPVLILYGEKDKILPDVAKTMTRAKKDLPQAIVKSYPNAGHFLQEDVSEELSVEIKAFLNA
ncbi:MAG: alpha/beta fold hydrolase [Cytophagales bacterium]|nr:alpha/beta fold hydrolase [Cytophagales bacterium]